MSTVPDLATMQLLLRQGALAGMPVAGPVAGGVAAARHRDGLAMIAAGLLLLSVAAGIAQAYHAWRVGLDADLLQLLRDEGLHDEAAARRTDQLLHDSGLRRASPAAQLRGWDARWAGMRRLLLRQYLLTAVQFALLLIAVLWPQT